MNLLDTDVVIELLRQKRYEEGSMNLPTSVAERVKGAAPTTIALASIMVLLTHSSLRPFGETYRKREKSPRTKKREDRHC
jgi:hypothetical protein